MQQLNVDWDGQNISIYTCRRMIKIQYNHLRHLLIFLGSLSFLAFPNVIIMVTVLFVGCSWTQNVMN